MFIKNRTETRRLVIVSSKTKPQEDIDATDLDRRDRNKGSVMINVHYVVKRDGTVETGRELDKLGNYNRRYNKDSVFVLLVGSRDNLTKEQKAVYPDIEDELTDLYPIEEVIDLT